MLEKNYKILAYMQLTIRLVNSLIFIFKDIFLGIHSSYKYDIQCIVLIEQSQKIYEVIHKMLKQEICTHL